MLSEFCIEHLTLADEAASQPQTLSNAHQVLEHNVTEGVIPILWACNLIWYKKPSREVVVGVQISEGRIACGFLAATSLL